MSTSGRKIMRSWPWTLALAGILVGFLLLGMFGLSVRTSTVGKLLSFAVIVGALLALYRVLTSGVHVLPSGLIVRELTRSTPVPWPRIRSITTAPTGRRGIYAPVLTVGSDKLELIVLAAYSEEVAARRTEELKEFRRRHTS